MSENFPLIIASMTCTVGNFIGATLMLVLASDNLAPTDRVDMRRTELVNEFTEIVEDW